MESSTPEHATQTITRDNIPPEDEFTEYAKITPTKAVRVSGPFTVETSEGPLTCEDGWLAIDAEGNPYPISHEVFVQTYQEVPDDAGQEQEAPDDPSHAVLAADNGATAIVVLRSTDSNDSLDERLADVEAVAVTRGFSVKDVRTRNRQ